MLTPEEKKRLAAEAEKMAMECLEGRAPPFGACYAELRNRAKYYGFVGYFDPGYLIADASYTGLLSGYAARLVFPLLALCDAVLEAP